MFPENVSDSKEVASFLRGQLLSDVFCSQIEEKRLHRQDLTKSKFSGQSTFMGNSIGTVTL